MTITAAILVMFSALLHASWNLFSKSRSPTVVFFQLATIGTVVWFSPILFFASDLLIKISYPIWGILIIGGLFQAIYYTGLAGAYARGAMSIAYPLARSLPLLFVTALTSFVGHSQELSVTAIVGITAIIAGSVILPINRIKDVNFKNYVNPSCAFAVLAAVGTAGYSFVDDIGMNMLKLIQSDAQGWMRALLYLVLECVFTIFWLQILIFSSYQLKADFRLNWRNLLRPSLFTGLVIGVTYGIILLAMTLSTNVSYVVGMRQLSIPIGALMGMFILKEPTSIPRLIGVGILFAGLVLLSLG